jgi:hypothetical protein
VSWTASLHRPRVTRPWHARSVTGRRRSQWPLDVGIAAAALAGSLALLAHGGRVGLANPRGNLDLVSVALVAVATAPLVAWRRSPLAVFVASASASAALAALGNVIWPVGPATALYLLASSRDRAAPWSASRP